MWQEWSYQLEICMHSVQSKTSPLKCVCNIPSFSKEDLSLQAMWPLSQLLQVNISVQWYVNKEPDGEIKILSDHRIKR